MLSAAQCLHPSAETFCFFPVATVLVSPLPQIHPCMPKWLAYAPYIPLQTPSKASGAAAESVTHSTTFTQVVLDKQALSWSRQSLSQKPGCRNSHTPTHSRYPTIHFTVEQISLVLRPAILLSRYEALNHLAQPLYILYSTSAPSSKVAQSRCRGLAASLDICYPSVQTVGEFL